MSNKTRMRCSNRCNGVRPFQQSWRPSIYEASWFLSRTISSVSSRNMSRFTVQHVQGFPSIAAFIASDPDKTTLVFRRFDRLAARNLLHLQAELAQIERLLDELDMKDSANMESLQCLRNWDKFMSAIEVDTVQQERSNLHKKLESTLQRYREAMLRESQIASLPAPTASVMKALSAKYTMQDSDEKVYPVLGGACSDLLSDEGELVSLRQPDHQDRLTAFVQEHLAFFFRTGKTDGIVAYAADRWIHHFVAWLSVLLSALLLIGAIVGLYVVQDPVKRLVMIGVFTAAFAIGVGLLTNARRAELFAATAAYAAVLVVFALDPFHNIFRAAILSDAQAPLSSRTNACFQTSTPNSAVCCNSEETYMERLNFWIFDLRLAVVQTVHADSDTEASARFQTIGRRTGIRGVSNYSYVPVYHQLHDGPVEH